MRFSKLKSLLLIFILTFSAFATGTRAQNLYSQAIERWRAAHEADLKKSDGWLTVAGLFWLKDGANTVGAGEDYDVALPANFKGRFGTIDFQNGAAILKMEHAVTAIADGKNFSEIRLVSDEKGNPTTVKSGSVSFYLIKREDRFGIRVKDENNASRTGFTGEKWFPVDKKYLVTAKFEKFDAPKEVFIPNILGGSFKMKSPGILRFKLGGKKYSLQPIEEEDHLFIIFRDLSSRAETYGAGRFLYAEKPVDGKVILDFNKAENPPCAFTKFATCPLPPQQNRLDVEINAGEKRYDH